MMSCIVCGSEAAEPFRVVDEVDYFECGSCGSIFADPAFIDRETAVSGSHYDETYWRQETDAARHRSSGSSLQRAAEVFFYARKPVERFLDVSAGPGYLIDYLSQLLPAHRSMFHAVEPFPPPAEFRSAHENYTTRQLGEVSQIFDAGLRIEVIEHLSPKQLDGFIEDVSRVFSPGAVIMFNSGQPDYVREEDPDYLDPHVRGHIVSYSLKALRPLFEKHGFQVIALPGRSWAFLAEKTDTAVETGVDALLDRVWTIHPHNKKILTENGFGPLLYNSGMEAARSYLEFAKSSHFINYSRELEARLQGMADELAVKPSDAPAE